METRAVARGSRPKGVQRNHLRADPGLPRKGDIAWPGDLVGRMGLITGQGGWLGDRGVVRGMRGHQGGGRAYTGSAARSVVQPLEQLGSLEVVRKAEAGSGDGVGQLLVGDVVR